MNTRVYQTNGGDVAKRTFTFSDQNFINQTIVKSDKQDFTTEEVESVFATLLGFVDANLNDGTFGISQNGRSWFGKGAKKFYKSLMKTYDDLATNRRTHHREIGMWIGPGRSETGPLVISCHRCTDQTARIEDFTIGFTTTNDSIAKQLNELELDMNFEFENQIEYLNYFADTDLKSRTVVDIDENKSPQYHQESKVDTLICKNPFHEQPEDLINGLKPEGNSSCLANICDSFAAYEHIMCYVSPKFDPRKTPTDYQINEFRITDLNRQTATGVGCANVYVELSPKSSN